MDIHIDSFDCVHVTACLIDATGWVIEKSTHIGIQSQLDLKRCDGGSETTEKAEVQYIMTQTSKRNNSDILQINTSVFFFDVVQIVAITLLQWIEPASVSV